MRKEIYLNEKWLFHRGEIDYGKPVFKGPVYSQSKTERKKIGPAAYNYFDIPDCYGNSREMKNEKWEYVTLPHDYIVAQDLEKDASSGSLGFLPYDNAWYRRHFTLPEDTAGKRVILRFDGIAGKSVVYLNGCLMYHNYSAYNTFEVDISDNVYYDKENVIAIYVNTKEFEGWWYQGGGIYRDVHLVITDSVAIDLWGVYAPYKKIGENEWQIDFETTIVNADYQDVSVTAETYVLGKDGNCIAKSVGKGTVALRDTGILKYSATVKNPLLWDCDNPNLYTVKTVLKKNGEPIDENITRIGFRTVEISVDKGLLLNGEKTIIKGVCSHQDFGLTGLVMPDNVARYKIKLIKQMGANGFRTSHYQNSAVNMDLFDEMGFLVMNEARWFESTKEAMEQLESLVKRDRNRPSVILWSTSNEEPSHITDVGKRIHKAIAAHIRKFDKTRPITAAVSDTPDKCTIYDDCDVVGINYNLNLYDTIHEMYPQKALYSSECCATGTTRDWNFPTDRYGRIRDKDVDTNNWFKSRENTWKFIMERPFVFGAFQWDAVEHRGEADWPAICSKSGAIDLFLQKKGAFYQNKSHWTDEPMVHIVPHWNFRGLEGKDILVTVYTNCDELEILLNGRSLDRKSIEKFGHGEWNVPYESGELKVLGYKEGKLAAEHTRLTTGRPVGLKLTLVNEFEANGRDLALFTCECIDEQGNAVPDASEFVRFSVNSPAKIIGTGSDNCDHNNVANPERKMFMGKILVGVKPEKGQKEIILTAMSDNCDAAQIAIKTFVTA